VLTQLRGRSQITIPKNIIETLGLKENDNLNIEIENGRIVINPVVVIPKGQAWFWADDWQQSEKAVDEDIKAGKIKTANSIDDLMKSLNDED
jgi:AbrB family looped-hinge helix DNA binding protein